MNTTNRFLDECASFLKEHAPEQVVQELVKPYPESELHAKSFVELKAALYEARSYQHTYKHASIEEQKHFEFVDEATAILEFKRLDELSKATLGGYIKKSADKLADGSFKSGAAAAMQTPEDERKKQRHTNNNRYSGILKATRKIVENSEQLDELSSTTLNNYVNKSVKDSAEDSDGSKSVPAKRISGAAKAALRTQGLSHKPGSVGGFKKYTTEEALDELSTKTLADYREKSSQEVGSYKFGSKAPTTKMSDVHKRIKGFVSAGGKIKAKNAKTNIQSEEVEQIEEAMSLVKTYSSPSKSKEAKVYKDKEWGEFRVKHFIDGQHQAKADYHTDDLDDAHGTAKKHIKESLDEAAMPLKGHDYHTKSDASLNYIIKDAGEARDALGNDHPSNGKYSDQINNARTVLHFRKNGGKSLEKTSRSLPESFSRDGALNKIKNLLG
jgi:hypothetical protein